MVAFSIVAKNLSSRCQSFGLGAITRVGLQPDRVHSPVTERKINATQDR